MNNTLPLPSTYKKKYYENNKIVLFPEKPRELQIIEKIPCQYCGRFLTAIELKQDKKSRHYINHCRGNPDYLYKGRKSGNFKKLTPEEEAKTALDIKREEKRKFREMYHKLIREKTMDIDTIFKLYGKQIEEYKYIT